METLIAFVAGSAVTWLVTWIYYKRAGDELRAESSRLRHLNTLILRAMEDRGLAKLARDATGEITGLRFELKAESGAYAVSSAEADLTVKRRDAAV